MDNIDFPLRIRAMFRKRCRRVEVAGHDRKWGINDVMHDRRNLLMLKMYWRVILVYP